LILNDRDQLETEWMGETNKLSKSSLEERRAYTQNAFKNADAITAQWVSTISSGKINEAIPFYYRHFRRTVDKQAEFHN